MQLVLEHQSLANVALANNFVLSYFSARAPTKHIRDRKYSTSEAIAVPAPATHK